MSNPNLETSQTATTVVQSPSPTARESAQADDAERYSGPTGSIITTRDVIRNQAERIERLLGLLRALEWSWAFDGFGDYCRICEAHKSKGHAPDCPLDAELKGGK